MKVMGSIVRDTQGCLNPVWQRRTSSQTSSVTVGLLALPLPHHCNYWCCLVKSCGWLFYPHEGCKGDLFPLLIVVRCRIKWPNCLCAEPRARTTSQPTSSPSHPVSHSLPSTGPCQEPEAETMWKKAWSKQAAGRGFRVKLLPKA